jgi:hypothetical protein
MMTKHSTRLIIATILVAFLSLGFIILEEGETEVSINGVVCNHSSADLWLAVTEVENPENYMLESGDCTNFFKQDAEAIWGKECIRASCTYQAWKLGAGRFDVYEDANSSSSVVLRIEGWGAGSRWHITRDWPKPKLSAIDYSLVR